MVMAKPSVNQGEITSANSTNPKLKTAKLFPVPRACQPQAPILLSGIVHGLRLPVHRIGHPQPI